MSIEIKEYEGFTPSTKTSKKPTKPVKSTKKPEEKK